MKNLVFTLLLLCLYTANAQDRNVAIQDSTKDSNGIDLNAPKGTHQYAFRIGEWNSTYQSLVSRSEIKTGTGRYRVFVAQNGRTFVEEGLDENEQVKHRITFDYIEATNSWENHFLDLKTGREFNYTSKIIDGSLVETIQRENSVNNNYYTILGSNVFMYTAYRTFEDGHTIINHVGISTK